MGISGIGGHDTAKRQPTQRYDKPHAVEGTPPSPFSEGKFMHRKIVIETVDADKMRYETEGDWFFDEAGNLTIQVAVQELMPNATGDVLSDEGFLIALHELVEVKLCMAFGISQEEVDEFDVAYSGDGEPGDDPNAPYRLQHRFACIVEHLMARELGMIGYGVVS